MINPNEAGGDSVHPVVHFLLRASRHPLTLLVLGLALCVAAIFAMVALAKPQIPSLGNGLALELMKLAVPTIGTLIGYLLFVRFIEMKPLRDFALKGAALEVLAGLFIGALLISAVVAVIAAAGNYNIAGFGVSEKQWLMLAIGVCPGILEEILFRGLLFRFVEQWLGSIAALLISAIVFGLMHLSNPNATLVAGIAIALEAGILLGAIYMVTRRLWAPIGLHAAWNYVQGGVYNIPVSGTDVDGILKGHVNGPEWLTGGAFGVEASVPAIIICTAAGLWFLRKALKEGQFISPSWSRFKTGEER